jgi:aminoglycoside-2''-adenylyltransferase
METEQLAALRRVHQLLERHGVDYWLFGGWAVDFHAGTITRPHSDLDIAIWVSEQARLAELLEAEGWTHTPDPDEDGSTLYERGDVRLEVAFLARAEDGQVYTPLREGRAPWADGAFGEDVAELRGTRARVIGLQALISEKSVTHDDALATAKDRADIATLSAGPPSGFARPRESSA